MRGILGYCFNGVQHGLWKEVVLVDVGVCANIHGQLEGLGTDTYFYFLFKFSDKRKTIAGIASSFAMELYGRVFYSISGLKEFCLRLHHQPV